MSICRGCGGILGRDCWNEYDCIQISIRNDRYDRQRDQEERDSIQEFVDERDRDEIPF